jgi:hypothetical protein
MPEMNHTSATKNSAFALLPGQPRPETFSKIWNFGKVKKSNHPLHSVKLK